MKKLKFFKIIFILAVILAAGVFWYKHKLSALSEEATTVEAVEDIQEIKDIIVPVEVEEKDTYGKLMEDAGVSGKISIAIYEAAKEKYDLAKIRLGKFLELVYDESGKELKELRYKIDSEDELIVKNVTFFQRASSTDGWFAEINPIAYEIKTVVKSGLVDSSMYQSAIDNGIDVRAIIELANAFQWSIDFAMDPRVGDKFKFIYEERYFDGEYEMPGKILSGYYINAGTKYEVYYFEESEDNKGYFDQDGNSVQKMFLKAPVEFKYISSGYTTGNRVVMEIGLSGPHLAIDYAAPIGTPIRTVGDGTVIFSGWKTGYGYFVSIRHNGTYTTNYAHQSKVAVKYGQKVVQGETIGYVGSTGYSTGPHLHFEMVKNGVKINPLEEVLPPGEAIKEENRQRFFDETSEWRKILDEEEFPEQD
jgi:murein DD-endopeptidase MepM/ murein hydrolase activator NlpD